MEQAGDAGDRVVQADADARSERVGDQGGARAGGGAGVSRCDLSVVAPCYNEAKNLPELVERLLRVFEKKKIEGEVVILETAKRLFLAQGFDGVSMDQIAAEAGVSKLTVYSHYGDKETLFGAAAKAWCEQQLPSSLFEARPDVPLRERLFSEVLRNARDLPPEVQQWLENSEQTGGYIFSFLLMLVCGSLAAALGGAVGASYFRKDVPPALGGPPPPPPLP